MVVELVEVELVEMGSRERGLTGRRAVR